MGWSDIKNSEYLSITQINMLQRCPKQYEFRYVRGIKAPPTSSLILGTSVHKGCELNYTTKYKTKTQAKLSEVMDAYSQAYESADITDMSSEEKQDYKKSKDNGYAMTKAHYERLAPSVVPINLPEEEFMAQLPGIKRPILGYIDLYGKIFGSKQPVIIDNKTSRAKWTQWQADCSLQLKLYRIVKAQQLKCNVEDISASIDAILNQKTVSTQRIFADPVVDQDEIFKCISQIEVLIDEGLFYPTYNHQTCSWCGYAHICRPSIFKRREELKNAQ